MRLLDKRIVGMPNTRCQAGFQAEFSGLRPDADPTHPRGGKAPDAAEGARRESGIVGLPLRRSGRFGMITTRPDVDDHRCIIDDAAAMAAEIVDDYGRHRPGSLHTSTRALLRSRIADALREVVSDNPTDTWIAVINRSLDASTDLRPLDRQRLVKLELRDGFVRMKWSLARSESTSGKP